MTDEEKKEYHRKHALLYYHNNKEKCALKAKTYRLQNKEHVRTKQREDKRNRKLSAIEYLGGKCNECSGAFHPSVYEFHHVKPEDKDKDPSKMLTLSWERLTHELDKCRLLCANCHRLEHHKRNYE